MNANGPYTAVNMLLSIGLLMFFSAVVEPVWATGKLVVLDSGFCVLQGLVELKKKGVYAHALIKKRKYWPRHIPGDNIITHFANKEVGDVDAICGELDDIPFYIYGMKEPDYVMQLMATYGILEKKGVKKVTTWLEDSNK